MVRIADSARDAMREHAEGGYPFEICGLLVGTGDDTSRTVRHAWPVRNAWEEDPALRAQLIESLSGVETTASAADWEAYDTSRRFLISPRDVMLAMKRARAERLDLIGVYHTHPNHPAVPSEYDRSVAQPEWSYVILSVREGAVAELRSWVLNEDGTAFGEEDVLPL